MANYYKEINKMFEKVIHRVLLLDKKGFELDTKSENFSFLDIYIIKKIGKDKEKSIYSLIKETEIDRGLMTSIINRMVSTGYLEKERSEKDKRVYMLRLTERGQDIFNDIVQKQKKLLDFILNDITLNEEKAILKFLSKVALGSWQILVVL